MSVRLTYESRGDKMEIDIEKLYELYFMKVYSYVMTLSKNQSTAEEITQNTFFKAMQSRQSHKGQSSELTWLCAIAKNMYIDEYRKRTRQNAIDDIEGIESNDSVETNIENDDSSYRIHCILHSLEEPYKEVFHLRVFGELSFKTIGKIFGKTENWARVTYHRARLKIRERIDEK